MAAINRMGSVSRNFLEDFLEIFNDGLVDRKLVASTILNCGGKQILLEIL